MKRTELKLESSEKKRSPVRRILRALRRIDFDSALYFGMWIALLIGVATLTVAVATRGDCFRKKQYRTGYREIRISVPDSEKLGR